MKRLFLVSCLLSVFVMAGAKMRWNKSYQQYFDMYKDLAIEQMLKYRIPASITLAQGVFESGAGQSALARKGNNHFGIKCHEWRGNKVYFDDDAKNECFRAYSNVYESFEDHSKFLVNGRRYQKLFKLKITDYKGWAQGLKAAGYATNPQYATKLIEIIKLYKLYEYDRAKEYDRFNVGLVQGTSGYGLLRPIYAFNENYYVRAREGDTFRSLSKELGVSSRKLAKYNELSRDAVLSEGDVVYLREKQAKAPKEYKNRVHYVSAGESMYSIAQRYGIRLKNLYKINKLPKDYHIKEGDALKLR